MLQHGVAELVAHRRPHEPARRWMKRLLLSVHQALISQYPATAMRRLRAQPRPHPPNHRLVHPRILGAAGPPFVRCLFGIQVRAPDQLACPSPTNHSAANARSSGRHVNGVRRSRSPRGWAVAATRMPSSPLLHVLDIGPIESSASGHPESIQSTSCPSLFSERPRPILYSRIQAIRFSGSTPARVAHR